jgi:putative ABC transport system permease protein
VRSLWAAVFLIRRLRHERGVVLLILVLVAASAFLFAGAPRLLNRAADAAIRHDLRMALPVQRNIQLSTVSIIPPSEDPFGAIRRLGEGYLAELPDSVRRLVAGSQLSFTSTRFAVEDPPGYATFVSLRYQSGLEELIHVSEGRLPEATGEELPAAYFVGDPPRDEVPVERPVIEIALSEATAGEIEVEVGDVLQVIADGRDALVRSAFAEPLTAEFEVVGIFEVTDEQSELWYGERAVQAANIGGSLENPIAFATALVSPEAYPGLITSRLPYRYHWRYFVDPGRLDGGGVAGLMADLRRMETVYDTSGSDAAARAGVVLRSGLLQLLTDHLAELAATQAVLSVAAVGPLALAGGAIGMIGVLLVARRRSSTELALARGASRWLLLGAQLWEGLLIGLPAALAGWLLAIVLVPGRESGVSAVLAVTVGILPAMTLLVATWRASGTGVGRQRDAGATVSTSPRRLVLEATAVALAVIGVLLLRQRGLVIDASGAARFDPLLAAAPVLAAIAFGIVAMRLYPLPVRVLGWAAARRRDLVPVLGLREVGRHSSTAGLPLVVLMLTAAFSSFALVLTASVDRSQVDASWLSVAGDYRLETTSRTPFSARFDPSAVSGVEATAAGVLEDAAPFASEENQRSSLRFLAIDPAGYARVNAGAASQVRWPDALSGDAVHAGTPEDPLPAIVSRRLPPGSRPLDAGDTFETTVRGRTLTFRVVEERTGFPGLAEGAFVVASYPQVRHAYASPDLLPSIVLVRGPAEIEGPMVDVLRRQSASLLVSSRHAQYRALRDAPLVATISVGFALTMLVAAAYTAIAMVAALTLSAARRGREQALLRLMGVTGRQGLALSAVEHAPPVLLALLPGLVLGLGLAYLLAPGLGLSAFTGEGSVLLLHVDVPSILLVSVALLLVVTIAIGLATFAARRVRAAQALRIGED